MIEARKIWDIPHNDFAANDGMPWMSFGRRGPFEVYVLKVNVPN